MAGLVLGTMLTVGAACSSKSEGNGSLGPDAPSSESASAKASGPVQAPTSPAAHGSLGVPSGASTERTVAGDSVGNEAMSLPTACSAIGKNPAGTTLRQEHHKTHGGETLTCIWDMPPDQDRPPLAIVVNTRLFTSHDGMPGEQAAKSLATSLLAGGGPVSLPGADEARAKAVIGPGNAKVTTVDLVARKMNVVVDLRGQNYGSGADHTKTAAATLAGDVFKAIQFG